MTGDTSLIVVIIILAILVFLFSDFNKKPKSKYVVMKGGHAPKPYKSYNMPVVENIQDLYTKEAESYENFEDYIIGNGLEKSVTESHNQYVQDLQHRTSGASVETVTSHDENINPWVGLRRPDYSSIRIDGNAREVSSQTPEQLHESSNKKRYGYF